MGLSACMIMKNEEKFIYDCLKSMVGVVDEVILIDTGSTDKSIEIAKEFDFVKLGNFEWVKDFAAARNFALEQCTQDWCLWIDADERIKQKSIAEIISITEQKPEVPTAVNCTVESKHNDGRLSTVGNFRLWSNDKRVRFTGKIHEQIIPSFKKIKDAKIIGSNIILDHEGYHGDESEQQKKRDRNEEIMAEVLKKNPKDYFIHYTMAQNLMLNGKQEEALEHLIIVDKSNHKASEGFTASVKNALASIYFERKEYHKCYEYALKSVILEPRQVISYQLIAAYFYEMGLYYDSKTTINFIKRVQGLMLNKTKFIAHDNIVSDEWFYNILCSINQHLYKYQPGDLIIKQNGTIYGVHDDFEMQELPNIEVLNEKKENGKN